MVKNLGFEESGIYFPRNEREIILSSEQINELLCTIATEVYASSGKPTKSPAVITDSNGQLLCLAISREPGLPFESPTTLALRATSKLLGVAELVNTGVSVHLLQDSDGEIDALGDIYNFGPGRVVIGSKSPDVAQVVGALNSEDYWEEAALRRNMLREILLSSNREVRPTQLSANDFKISRLNATEIIPSSFSAKTIEKWTDVQVDTSDQAQLSELMGDLHLLAQQNISDRGGPFTAVVIRSDGKVLGLGENQVVRSSDPSAHGERVAMWSAIGQLQYDSSKGPTDLKDCTLIVSSFPCIGCAEACVRAGIREIIYCNSRETVQAMTPFTEGPLDSGRLAKLQVVLRQIKIDEKLAQAGFREFQRVAGEDPKIGYLNDLSRDR